MRVLVDTNVLIDVCGRAADFPESFFAMDIMSVRNDAICMLSCMISTIQYVVTSQKHAASDVTRTALQEMTAVFDVLDVAASDIQQALSSDMNDFEDAVIAFAAQRHNIDVIVTRDKDGFVGSPVAVLSPADFIAHFKPSNYDYDVVEFSKS